MSHGGGHKHSDPIPRPTGGPTPPDRLYLQIHDNPNDEFAWTHNSERIHDDDVEYVRARPTGGEKPDIVERCRQIGTDMKYVYGGELERVLHEAAAEITRLRELQRGGEAALEAMRASKDGAYRERNQVVVAFASMASFAGWAVYRSLHDPADTEWEDDWRNILVVESPEGQLTWHFHDSEADQLNRFALRSYEWDGHDTPEKYQRLAKSTLRPSPEEASPVGEAGELMRLIRLGYSAEAAETARSMAERAAPTPTGPETPEGG